MTVGIKQRLSELSSQMADTTEWANKTGLQTLPSLYTSYLALRVRNRCLAEKELLVVLVGWIVAILASNLSVVA
jgi:hypothetical protein